MSVSYPSFKTGGVLWFTDLSVTDPMYLLPVASALTMLLSIELGADTGQAMSQQKAGMKLFFRGFACLEEVRGAAPLVCFSESMRIQSTQLKRFLFQNLYRHSKVAQTTDWARNVVTDLFNAYINNPKEMPPFYQSRANLYRAVSDYIAGMTDRFAGAEHLRLCAQSSVPSEHLRAQII